jgi:hypothetical protein
MSALLLLKILYKNKDRKKQNLSLYELYEISSNKKYFQAIGCLIGLKFLLILFGNLFYVIIFSFQENEELKLPKECNLAFTLMEF